MQLKPSLRRLNKTIGFLVIIGLFFTVGYFLNNLFRVSFIKINSSKKITILGLDLVRKKNIFFVSEKELSDNLIKQNPYLKKIFIKKVYPNKLIIRIDLNRELAYFKTANGYLVLSKNSRILKKVKKNNPSLTTINYYQKFQNNFFNTGEFISYKDVVSTLLFLNSAQNINLKINSIDINNFNMIVFNQGNKKILFSAEKDTKTQIYELGKIIEYSKVEGKEYRSIDLRFDKPVISF